MWEGFLFSSVSKASACNARELGSIPGLGRSSGEGNSNPLQYSCLENPMDRGAWWATVRGIARVRHNLALFFFFSFLMWELTGLANIDILNVECEGKRCTKDDTFLAWEPKWLGCHLSYKSTGGRKEFFKLEFREGNQEFCFGHIKCEMPKRH